MADIEEPRNQAIEELRRLDSDCEYVLITRKDSDTGVTDVSVKSYVGDSNSNVPFLNMGGTFLLFLNQYFDNYSLDQVAQDVLKAARLQAQGGEISESD